MTERLASTWAPQYRSGWLSLWFRGVYVHWR